MPECRRKSVDEDSGVLSQPSFATRGVAVQLHRPAGAGAAPHVGVLGEVVVFASTTVAGKRRRKERD